MPKITMLDVARAAGVSRVTAWKVLTERGGVSEELNRRILEAAARLNYRGAGEKAPPVREKTFSLVVARMESSLFWMQIIHNIAKELARNHVNLMYTYMPAVWREGYQLPSSLAPEHTDGFIVLNIYDETTLRLLNSLPLPKVFLDVVPALKPGDLSGDLVLLEGYNKVRAIARGLVESGRKRLGFIGDAGYAQTNTDRLNGFVAGLKEAGAKYDPSLCLTGTLGLHTHYEEISRFLGSLPELPDAVVCASDFIAHYVRRYLDETGRPLPEGFLLTGFDNNTEYANIAGKITTVHVETGMLGRRLARQLLYRADYPAAPKEVVYVETRPVLCPPLDKK